MARKYELMYVLSPVLDEEANTALHEQVQNLVASEGTVDEVDNWGRKRLAYPIEDQTEGDYTVVTFTAESEAPAEIQRVLKITDGVMRYMVVAVKE